MHIKDSACYVSVFILLYTSIQKLYKEEPNYKYPFQSELREQEMYIFEQMNLNREQYRITKHYYCKNNDKLEIV